MSKRGRVLRDPSSTNPGLLIVEGQQYPFFLEDTWRSLTLPKPGLEVEVDFNPDGNVSSLAAVPDWQLAKEQKERGLAAAQETGSTLLALAVATFGMPTLIASAALVVGWFFLDSLTYDAGAVGRLEFTFWRFLGILNSSNGLETLIWMRDGGGAGLYDSLACLALAGPFVRALWKDRRAMLGGVLPLTFMLLVSIVARATLSSRAQGLSAEFADAAQAEIRNGISLGSGAYLSLFASFRLAYDSLRRFLAARWGR